MKKLIIIFIILGMFAGGIFLGSQLPENISLGRIKNYVLRNVKRKLALEPLDYGKEDMTSEKAKVKVTVYPDQEKRKISRLIYGTNLQPKMESSRPVLKFMKDFGITCFRYPGGDAPGWHWKGGYADFKPKVVDMPLGRVQVVSGVAELTGAEIIMQVNLESGTPKEAAGLVKFMNQESGTPVRYWQLGNEVYGNWDKAHMNDKDYAQVIKDYSDAMKAVDPTIKIGANWAGSYYDYIQWDQNILQLAGDYIDFVSYHWYPNHVNHSNQYKGSDHPNPEHIIANALAVPQIVARMHALIEQYAPQRKGKIEMTFLEWDGTWDAPASDVPPYEQGIVGWSLANALFYAGSYGEFAQNGVSAATLFTFQECPFGLIRGWNRGEGYFINPWDEETIRPKAFALKLFSKFYGDTVVEKKVEGGLAYSKANDWWPDSYTGDVPYLSVYTAKKSDSQAITIALINRHADAPIETQITIDDGKNISRRCIARVLTGPDMMAQNDGQPGTVSIVEGDPFVAESTFFYEVPPHSAVMLEIKKEP